MSKMSQEAVILQVLLLTLCATFASSFALTQSHYPTVLCRTRIVHRSPRLDVNFRPSSCIFGSQLPNDIEIYDEIMSEAQLSVLRSELKERIDTQSHQGHFLLNIEDRPKNGIEHAIISLLQTYAGGEGDVEAKSAPAPWVEYWWVRRQVDRRCTHQWADLRISEQG